MNCKDYNLKLAVLEYSPETPVYCSCVIVPDSYFEDTQPTMELYYRPCRSDK